MYTEIYDLSILMNGSSDKEHPGPPQQQKKDPATAEPNHSTNDEAQRHNAAAGCDFLKIFKGLCSSKKGAQDAEVRQPEASGAGRQEHGGQ
ncbi:MAG: hypothetical protein LQ338_003089 [Usnochroma carphineum]|nr:MAG: hypothetical protein LQ338_003089 [Usnochroma carphineum]